MSYLDYWGLHKNPFDSVPDPTMYFSSHSTVEGAVAELLFAIEEGNECLAVVVGEAGLGKTMALRVVLDELDVSRYRIAFITNPDMTFVQLLREIIGQLTGERCLIRDKETLLEEFNKLLFAAADSAGRVLIFIDEGNAMRGPNLESLRLLTNMQEDSRNLLTMIIVGQPKLARMLEHPSRENLFQRIGVYTRLEPISSPDLVKDYIEHRLERSGLTRSIFDEQAIHAVYQHSRGIPRLINRVCKLALKAGETNGRTTISEDLILRIAARFARDRKRSKESEEKRTSGNGNYQSHPLQSFVMEEPEFGLEDPVSSDPNIEDDSWARDTDGQEATASEAGERLELGPEPSDAHRDTLPASDSTPGEILPEESAAEDPVPSGETLVTSSIRSAGPDRTAITEDWSIPKSVFDTLRRLPDPKGRLRMAGQLSATELRDHPDRYTGLYEDPVQIWDELRRRVLIAVDQFETEKPGELSVR